MAPFGPTPDDLAYVGTADSTIATANEGPDTIQGTVWHDLNGDGVRDLSEPGIAGRTVFLDLNGNGRVDPGAFTATSDDVPKVIPDNAGTTSTISISDVPGVVTDVNVTLDISHTYDADLDAYLVSPVGTRVELFTDVGRSGNDFTNTTLDDEAATLITSSASAAPFSGSYRPEGSLADFDGDDISGTWTLEVHDDSLLDQGTLNGWSIRFGGEEEPAVQSGVGGEYTFAGIAPGSYTVAEVPTSGWTRTTPLGGTYSVILDGSLGITGRDFGYQDTTAPTVLLAVPGPSVNTSPEVTVTATDNDPAGLPDGTVAHIDVDWNNDGDFEDSSERSWASSPLLNGSSTFVVALGQPEGTFSLQSRVSDAAGNEGVSARHDVVIGSDSPTIHSLTPEDDSVALDVTQALVITFDQAVQKGTGNIVIRHSSDDSIFQTIPVTGQLVSIDVAAVNISPNPGLQNDTEYYVQIDSGAIRDEQGNIFGGISDETTWNFTTSPAIADDFGDAPAPYPTLEADNGAAHTATGPTLGANRDAEADGQPSVSADGDDTIGTPDDEDGVTFGSTIMVGQLDASVTVNIQGAPDAQLDAWIDFNADGSWGGPGEQIAVNLAVAQGDNVVQFDVPNWAASGNTYARFRLSYTGNLAPSGIATEGEVEDYFVTIAPPVAADGAFLEMPFVFEDDLGSVSVFAADLDGDGDNDVISANGSTDTVSWSENLGGGSFATHVISTSADYVKSIFVADVNRDGHLDVLSASEYDDTIAWYENDGNQSFTKRTISSTSNGAYSVFTADIDGDGDTDVLSTSANDGTIAWHENNGSEVFSKRIVSTSTNGARSVHAADIDGDGDIDVLSASYYDNKVVWHENDGSGGFSEHVITTAYGYAVSVRSADFDGDGDMDVLSGHYRFSDPSVVWHENNGSGGFTSHVISDEPDALYQVSVADIDGDGDMDALSAASYDGAALWFENDGAGRFTRHSVASDVNYVRDLIAADMDGDGLLDAVAALWGFDGIAWYMNVADAASFTIFESEGDTSVSESGSTDTFSVMLNSRPASNKVVTITNPDPTELTLNETSLTFTTSNWDTPQVVTVTGVDDTSIDFDQITGIEVTMGGYLQTVSVTTTDDEAASMSVIESDGRTTVTEGARTDSFSIALDATPDSNVVLTITSDDPDEASVDNPSLTFTPSNWNIPQVVTVSSADDGLVDGIQTSTITIAVDPLASDDAFDLMPSETVSVMTLDELSIDFGDAPAPYPTRLSDDGAQHIAIGPRLGANRDAEHDGQPSSTSDGDDEALTPDDEDGVTFGSTIMVGQLDAIATVNVQNSPDGAKLDAWIDLNGDGSWNGPGEQIAHGLAVSNGDNLIEFDVPSSTPSGDVYARFRLSTNGGLTPSGFATNGEVEDHVVNIVPTVENDGVFTTHAPISTSYNGVRVVLAADVDGDGDMDMVSGSGLDNTIAWHENLGDGVFLAHNIAIVIHSVESLFAVDMEGDGDLDIISALGIADTVAWYENDGSGEFTAHDISTAVDDAQSVHAADMDGDGDVDVISAASDGDQVLLHENDGRENFTTRALSASAHHARSVHAADVDSDGDMDILVAAGRDMELAWYENNGAGSFAPHSIATNASYYSYVLAADMDGDGDMDAVSAAGSSGAIAWHENDGNQNFTQREITDPADRFSSVFVADIDGDGDMDAVCTSPIDNVLAWYENDGVGNFTERAIALSARGPVSPLATDVDGDGDLDIVAACYRDDTIAWLENHSDVQYFSVATDGDDTTVSESGTTDTFTVVLDSEPESDVVLMVTVGVSAEVSADKSVLTFTPENWDTAQTVTVTGLDDAVVDGAQTSVITVSVDTARSAARFFATPNIEVSVTTTDDEVADFSVSESDGGTAVSESGTTDTFTVVLDGKPLSDVVINVASGDLGEATVDQASLTFTPDDWDTAQMVTVSGVSDGVVDGDYSGLITLSINGPLSNNYFDAAADQTVSVTTVDIDAGDFGDAPSPYPTLIASGGAVHIVTGPTLGVNRDADDDGQPNVAADGDDIAGTPNDEDGVTFGSTIMVGQLDASVTVNVQNAPAGARLDAWIDFNGDGSWGGLAERIASSLLVSSGDNLIEFDVPSWAVSGEAYARFRLSTAGGLAPGGQAGDGEVEDYRLTVLPPAQADGLFAEHHAVSSIQDGPSDLFAADMDGDGDVDIVATSYFDDQITWHENDGAGSFSVHTITSYADGAESAHVADIDGDGDLDVLAGSSRSSLFAWYENDGSQHFSRRHTYLTVGGVQSVFAADVDGDGDTDLLTAANSSIEWHENNGSEVFTSHLISPARTGSCVYSADMDGDGDMDVLSAARGDDAFVWYENDGQESFTAHTIADSARDANSVFASDMDGDGDMDVLVGSADTSLKWYENDGSGSFSVRVISAAVNGIWATSPADVDGDGDIDVLAASYENDRILWYENDGEEEFAAHTVATSMNGATSAVAADVDGDGDLDILSAAVLGDDISWHENVRGDRDFGDAPSSYATLDVEGGPSHIAVGPTLGTTRDYENDGQPSVAADGDNLAGTPDDEDGVTFGPTIMVGRLDASATVNVQNAPAGAKLDAWIDFDGDGAWGSLSERIAEGLVVSQGDNVVQFDVPAWAVSGETYARFRLSTDGNLTPRGIAADGEIEDYRVSILAPPATEGTFAASETLADIHDLAATTPVDLDGDGDMDLLSSSRYGGTINWHDNDGSGTFVTRTVVTSAYDSSSLVPVDLDGDGDLDVFLGADDSYSSRIRWCENDGSQGFTVRTVGFPEVDNATVADIDGDGDLDILTTSDYGDTLAWGKNDGNGDFTVRLIANNVWHDGEAVAVDMDGDGDMDILSSGDVLTPLAWYENDGNQNFTVRAVDYARHGCDSKIAMDVDGDGDVDIITASGSSGSFSVHLNDGNETFAWQGYPSFSIGIDSMSAADMDGDGDLDLVVASSLHNYAAWLENNHDGTFSFHSVAHNSGMESVAVADMDGDGDMDILSVDDWDGIDWHENLGGNAAPALAPIGDRSTQANVTLTFTATAADSDLPAQSLTFSLGSNAPVGATIDPITGVFTWTPTASQATGDHELTVRVIDDGWPAMRDFETITVTVDDGVPLTVTGTTPDLTSVLPPISTIDVTFSETIDASTFAAGDVSLWTVSGGELVGPAQSAMEVTLVAGNTYRIDFGETIPEGEYELRVGPEITSIDSLAMDQDQDGTPGEASDDMFTVRLTRDWNDLPVLGVIGDQGVAVLNELRFTATANDIDLPAQGLTFSLDPGAPAGAMIDPDTGVFTWTPTVAQSPGVYDITIRVTDDGTPSMEGFETFTVTVDNGIPLMVTGTTPELAGSLPPMSAIDVTFSEPIDPATFGLGDVSLWNVMGGEISGLAHPATEVTHVTGDTYRIDFGTPLPEGEFELRVGPAIVSHDSLAMDQDQDRTPGETSDDVFTARFVVDKNYAPVLDSIGPKNSTPSTELTFTVTATDVDEPAQALTFSLDSGAPAGAAIDPVTGVFTWTPTEAQGPGVYEVTVRVTDNGTPAMDAFETFAVTVYPAGSSPINFQDHTIGSYAGGQDAGGTATVEDDGATLRLNGNTWKQIDFNYTVTPDTVLSFDFQSSRQAEVHAIGFDDDLALSSDRAFQVYGIGLWGLRNFYEYVTVTPGVMHFDIPVGKFFTGEMSYLFFVNDDDRSVPTGESVYSNIRVHDTPATPDVIDFRDHTIDSYAGGQDGWGWASIQDDSTALRLNHNVWKQINFAYTITPDTVLSFDFESWRQGEVHAIGFDDDVIASGDRGFQIYGTERWGLGDFNDYATAAPGVRHYDIPVGQFYTGDMSCMFFISDHDSGLPWADSTFSNIRVHEDTTELLPGVIDLRDHTIIPYGGGQDAGGTATVEYGGATLRLNGNAWKAIELPRILTPETILEFDFSSSSQGEVHAIGLDTDDSLGGGVAFQLYGTDRWGRGDFNDYLISDGVKHYEIPVGQFLTGEVSHLFFTNDHDAAPANGESVFSNIRVYTPGVIDFSSETIDSYAGGQDAGGTATVTHGGTSLHMQGNAWKKIDFDYAITPNTILSFDFSSAIEGEMHAIGFDDDVVFGGGVAFQLFGTERVGFNDFNNYTTADGIRHYDIPVGRFFTGDVAHLFFSNDHDGSPSNGESIFANLRVHEADTPLDPDLVNFNAQAIGSYAGGQDAGGTATIEDNGASLHIRGNAWKRIEFEYAVTPNTILSFDFSSAVEGEMHAIGFDNDLAFGGGVAFQLFGTERVGLNDFNNYTTADGVKHYDIPVGRFFTGDIAHLFFTNDHDAGPSNGESVFSNIRVHEDETPTDPSLVNFNAQTIGSYAGGQDAGGTASIQDAGTTLQLTGNCWKQIDLAYTVTPDTILAFDFQSTSQGEVHAIGLDDGLTANWDRGFQLYGTDRAFTHNDFNDYATTAPGVKHYEIPVGQFFTGNMAYLFFVNDHDIGLRNGESVYSNLRIYEGGAAATGAFLNAMASSGEAWTQSSNLLPEEAEVVDDSTLLVVDDRLLVSSVALRRNAYEIADYENGSGFDPDESEEKKAIDLLMALEDWDL